MDLLSTDSAHAIIAFTGFYELALSRRIASLASFGGKMIDVGANYGYYTCLWAGARVDNRVFALEASPRNVGPLRANVCKNHLEPRVTVLGVAAGRDDGTVALTLGPEDQSGWAGIIRSGDPTAVQVPCVRIDRVASEIGWDIVDVLKVDVEGADTWVLYGAERLLKAGRIRHVFFEHNPVRMANLGIAPTEAASWLKGLGYRLERLSRGEWYATPSTVPTHPASSVRGALR
jgi:FkbM family methyltransferase